MTAGHLVTFGDLSLLDDVDSDLLENGWWEWVFVSMGVDLDLKDDASAAMWDTEGAVFGVFALLTEDGHEKLLFWGGFALSFWCDLTNEDVAFFDFGAWDDNAVLIEVFLGLFADVWNVSGDMLVSEFGLTALKVIGLDVDGGVGIILDHLLGHDDGVFVVITVPGHVGDEDVLTKGEFAILHGWAIGDDLPCFDLVANFDDWALVDAGTLVGTVEFL